MIPPPPLLAPPTHFSESQASRLSMLHVVIPGPIAILCPPFPQVPAPPILGSCLPCQANRPRNYSTGTLAGLNTAHPVMILFPTPLCPPLTPPDSCNPYLPHGLPVMSDQVLKQGLRRSVQG